MPLNNELKKQKGIGCKMKIGQQINKSTVIHHIKNKPVNQPIILDEWLSDAMRQSFGSIFNQGLSDDVNDYWTVSDIEILIDYLSRSSDSFDETTFKKIMAEIIIRLGNLNHTIGLIKLIPLLRLNQPNINNKALFHISDIFFDENEPIQSILQYQKERLPTLLDNIPSIHYFDSNVHLYLKGYTSAFRLFLHAYGSDFEALKHDLPYVCSINGAGDYPMISNNLWRFDMANVLFETDNLALSNVLRRYMESVFDLMPNLFDTSFLEAMSTSYAQCKLISLCKKENRIKHQLTYILSLIDNQKYQLAYRMIDAIDCQQLPSDSPLLADIHLLKKEAKMEVVIKGLSDYPTFIATAISFILRHFNQLVHGVKKREPLQYESDISFNEIKNHYFFK